MNFRNRAATARNERPSAIRSARRSFPRRDSHFPSIMRPFLAGMASTAVVLYLFGWDFTAGGAAHTDRGLPPAMYVHGSGRNSPQGIAAVQDRKSPSLENSALGNRPTRTRGVGDGRLQEGNSGPAQEIGVRNGARNDAQTSAIENAFVESKALRKENGESVEDVPFFSEADAAVVVDALKAYELFAASTLAKDEKNAREGYPVQGKYIVLSSGNELVNRLRGVLSGFLLGVLTDRVFVADITYQKDATQGLLSALFEGPGYQWDLSELSPILQRALAPSSSIRGAGSSKILEFDMSKEHFEHWVCDDVLEPGLSSIPVVTLSTVVYPLPLIVRNPQYASHPIVAGLAAGGQGSEGAFARSDQERIEALETLLTRLVLRPTQEMRERTGQLARKIRGEAARWGERRGLGRPPKVVGLHVRTYFVKAISPDKVETNVKQLADCAVAGSGGENVPDDIFYFVATDMAETQASARKILGDGCYFVPFNLPGSRLEGIKSALVDLLVMGSLDDYVMTPHSSFSELGASLSYTWLSDAEAALRARPNRPIVPFFRQMNDFERRKIRSLLDRRAEEISVGDGRNGSGSGVTCMRTYTAGMSVTIAKGVHLMSMFESIETSHCFQSTGGVANSS